MSGVRGQRPGVSGGHKKSKSHERPVMPHGAKSPRKFNDRLANRADALTPGQLVCEEIVPPAWYDEIRSKCFLDMRNTVALSNIAAQTDKFSLYLLCSNYAEYMSMCETIANDGFMIDALTAKGEEIKKIHPLLAEKNRLYTNIKSMLTEFGLTPNSRRGVVKAEPDKVENPEEQAWDDLLN